MRCGNLDGEEVPRKGVPKQDEPATVARTSAVVVLVLLCPPTEGAGVPICSSLEVRVCLMLSGEKSLS